MHPVSLLLLAIALTTVIQGTEQQTAAAEFTTDVDNDESGDGGSESGAGGSESGAGGSESGAGGSESGAEERQDGALQNNGTANNTMVGGVRRSCYYPLCKTIVPYKPVLQGADMYCCGDTVKLTSHVEMTSNDCFWNKFIAEVKRAVDRAICHRCEQCRRIYYKKKH